MANSQDILNQIQSQYGNIGDAANVIESTIKNAYAPSIKALVEEGNTLRGQYYPAFFNEAQKLGTTAADMSPAARLAAMQQAGENMGQLYRTNLGLRDFYNTDINNLVGRAQNQYMNAYNALKDQYTMALQGEQARAAQANANANAKYIQSLIDLLNGDKTNGTITDNNLAIEVPDNPLSGDLATKLKEAIASMYGQAYGQQSMYNGLGIDSNSINNALQNAYTQNFNAPYIQETNPIPNIGIINNNSTPNIQNDIFKGMIGTSF